MPPLQTFHCGLQIFIIVQAPISMPEPIIAQVKPVLAFLIDSSLPLAITNSDRNKL